MQSSKPAASSWKCGQDRIITEKIRKCSNAHNLGYYIRTSFCLSTLTRSVLFSSVQSCTLCAQVCLLKGSLSLLLGQGPLILCVAVIPVPNTILVIFSTLSIVSVVNRTLRNAGNSHEEDGVRYDAFCSLYLLPWWDCKFQHGMQLRDRTLVKYA